MDEIELRLAALELWAVEVGAWLEPQALDDAAKSITVGLESSLEGDELTIRRGALHLIEQARGRFRPPAVGVKL